MMDYDKAFNVFISELTGSSKGNTSPVTVGSRFLSHAELEKRAAKEGCEVRNLPLAKLGGRVPGGVFCLRTDDVAEIDGLTVLSEYGKLDDSQNLNFGGVPTLTVYWTRKYTYDLSKRLKDMPDAPEPSGSELHPPSKPDPSGSKYDPALDTPYKMAMSKISKADTPYDLVQEAWANVIEGNRLLYGFQSDQAQIESLAGMNLSTYLSPGWQTNVPDPPAPTPAPAPGPNQPADTQPKVETIVPPGINITSTTSLSTYGPFSLSISPIFRANPAKTMDKQSESDESKKSPDFLWSNSKSVSTTSITKEQSTLDQWSTESGMSKSSAKAGLSLPIGKATLGTKFGFSRETSHSSKKSGKKGESCYTASHVIPKADIVLNERTLLVSSDAEASIRRLRKLRNFGDLLSFYEKYGTMIYQNVTLGGRLYHTRQFSSNESKSEFENTKKFSVSASASLGIPSIIDVNAGGSHEKSEAKGGGSTSITVAENLQWTGFGGNPSLVVDPPQWRESLNDYKTWRAIQHENPILIRDLLGKMPGFSDIPVLFSDILASGVLNSAMVALPPNSTLQLGMSVDPKTGAGKAGTSPSKIEPSIEAPAGFSWNVLADAKDLKSEIRANFQQTFNPVVNLLVDLPFLIDIKADPNTFTVMLRWNSPTVKYDWPADGTEEAAAKAKDLAADGNLANQVFVKGLTARSWVIGFWRIKRKTMSNEDFNDTKSGFIKYFSDPQSIAGGCSFINKLSSNAELEATFYLYASDGPTRSEVKVLDAVSPKAAFNFIDQRVNLSSIHILPIKAEVDSFPPDSPLPSIMNEVVLLEVQEVKASLAFLATFGTVDQKLSAQVTKLWTDHLFDSVAPLTAEGLKDLTAINDQLKTLELAVV